MIRASREPRCTKEQGLIRTQRGGCQSLPQTSPFSPSAFTKETHWLSKRIQANVRKGVVGGKRETFPSVILKESSNGIEPRCIEELYCSHTSLSGFPFPSFLPFLLPLQAAEPSSKSAQHQAKREGDKHAQRGCFVSRWTSNH